VYLLFSNKSPKPLVEGMRKLKLTGAITAGFEHNKILPRILDELSDASKLSNRVAMITNKGGKLVGHYQGGEGLLNAIKEKFELNNKKLVIVGAGTVANTLVLAIRQNKLNVKKITIVNRTFKNAKKVKSELGIVNSVATLDQLSNIEGDILINASRIGSKAEDKWFTNQILSKYTAVADVTFGVENTNLTNLARQHKSIVISGWDMFTHQAAIVLYKILEHNANIDILRQCVKRGLVSTNHGATANTNIKQ
jgi:shikimate 5-dehydrogenase